MRTGNPKLADINRSIQHRQAVSKTLREKHYTPMLGKHLSIETRAKLSQALRGKRRSPATEFKKGMIPWNKGGIIPEEIRAKMRGLRSGFTNQTSFKPGEHRSLDTEFRKGQPQWWFMRGIPCPNKQPEMRQKISEVVKHKYATDPSYREKVSQNATRQMANIEFREYLSRMAKERARNPEYIRKIMASRRPTDIEQIIIGIIEKYNLPYRYTGDGTFLLGKFNPDFVNTNHAKIAVDIFGDRWHTEDEIAERKASFAEYGWELVILWGHEVKSLTESELATRLAVKMRGAGKRL